MGQGQRVEAKKSGCRRTAFCARLKSKSGIFAIKVKLGNRYFGLSYHTRNGSKALRQPGKVEKSIKLPFEPTFIIGVWLKTA